MIYLSMIDKNMKKARPQIIVPLHREKVISINPKPHKSMIDYRIGELGFRFVCIKIEKGYRWIYKQEFYPLFRKVCGRIPKQYYKGSNAYKLHYNRKSTEFEQLIQNLEGHKCNYKIFFLNLQTEINF